MTLRMELKDQIKSSLREEVREELKIEERNRFDSISSANYGSKGFDPTFAPVDDPNGHGYAPSKISLEAIEKYNRILDAIFTENGLERHPDLTDLLSNILKKFSVERELKYQDKNACVNEITLKGLLLSVLQTCMDITGRNIGIWSEREVQFEDGRKGYIGLLLKWEDHFVIIESDYVNEALMSKSEDGSMTYFKRPDLVDGETKLITIEKGLWMTKLMKNHAESYARGLRNLLTKKATKKQFKFTCLVVCGYGTEVQVKVSVNVNRSGTSTPNNQISPRGASGSITLSPRTSFSVMKDT